MQMKERQWLGSCFSQHHWQVLSDWKDGYLTNRCKLFINVRTYSHGFICCHFMKSHSISKDCTSIWCPYHYCFSTLFSCAELLHFTEILNSRAYPAVENVGFVFKIWFLPFMVCVILTTTLNLLRPIFFLNVQNASIMTVLSALAWWLNKVQGLESHSWTRHRRWKDGLLGSRVWKADCWRMRQCHNSMLFSLF